MMRSSRGLGGAGPRHRPGRVPVGEDPDLVEGRFAEADVQIPGQVAPAVVFRVVVQEVVVRVPPRQLIERAGEQHDRRDAEEVIDLHLRFERLGELFRLRLVDQLDELDQPGGFLLRGLGLRRERLQVEGRVVAQELEVAPRSPLVDLEQGTVRVGQVVFDERLVDPLDVHVDAPVLLVHVQPWRSCSGASGCRGRGGCR